MKHRQLPQEAWVVLEDDLVALCDYRLPVFWVRSTAKRWIQEHGLRDVKIVRVTLNEGWRR